jgi:hypothetical protein
MLRQAHNRYHWHSSFTDLHLRSRQVTEIDGAVEFTIDGRAPDSVSRDMSRVSKLRVVVTVIWAMGRMSTD